MITGIDTNVLVRFLIHDDPKQAKIAREFITKVRQDAGKIFINVIVLCELVWVLDSGYKLKKSEIVGLLERLLSTREFEIQSSDLVWKALDDFRTKPADFSDCLIGRMNLDENAATTVTFDRKLKTLANFKVL